MKRRLLLEIAGSLAVCALQVALYALADRRTR